ncbi:unnamed protein product [Heterosigma akashiwo]|mmetsp:Transcript_42123/g.73229  ORF Transcript_42123/g.73229 Transcript_42123/m.73229 type:complete len:203 (+) Transcript_42123:50-658(+)
MKSTLQVVILALFMFCLGQSYTTKGGVSLKQATRHSALRPLFADETGEEVVEPKEENTSPKNYKGFGKPPVKKQKTAFQIEKEQAAQKYDEMASSGIPEYNIFAREFGTEQWFPVGVMAIPRTAPVGDVIYNSEENLKKGAYKIFPNLKSAEVLEYGYNLKQFPDDEIRQANRSEAAKGNPILGWVEQLLNPVDSTSSKTNQ